MPFLSDFQALFNEDDNTNNVTINFLQDDINELRATRSELERASVRHQQQTENSDISLDKIKQWDCLRRYYKEQNQAEKFSIILDLASRHSLAWTNQFIDSLVQLDTENTEAQTFTINTKRLETLIFLQKYFGLHSRDLSNVTSIYQFEHQDVELLNRGIEGDVFNQDLLDHTFDFLKKLKEKDIDLIHWIMFLITQGFLNFSMLNKKLAMLRDNELNPPVLDADGDRLRNLFSHSDSEEKREEDLTEDLLIKDLKQWLEQWATQCHMAKEMKSESTLEIEFIADSALTAHQRTIRNMVHYGLSPAWVNNIQMDAAPINKDFFSTLAYHQIQDIIFDENLERGDFVQAILQPTIEENTEPHFDQENNHEWIQTYTDPKDQYTLRQLYKALSINTEPALERLKFYHDYDVLPALIKQIQEGKLSLSEIAEYDKPLSYKECFDDKENNGWRTRFKDFCINNSPRILPRLLSKFSEPDTSLPLSERIKKMAAYDMYDYRPKPNPVPDKGTDEKVVTFFKLYDDYLQNYFDQVILPIAEERARLYLELIELQKKNEEQSLLAKSIFGSFDAQIHLVEQKIDIFSGFLEEACYEIKRAEMKAINSKKNNWYDDFCAMEYPRYISSYCEQIGFDDYWKRMKIQLFASDSIGRTDLSHQEVGIHLDKEGCLKFCYNQDVDGSRNIFNIMTDNLEEKLNPQTIKYIKEQLAHNKQNGVNKKQLTSKNEIYTIVTAIRKELLNSTVEPYGSLEQMKQNSLYRLERAGLNHASDEKNPQKTRSECREPVMNTPQNPVRSCLAFIIGKILAASKLIVQIPLIFSDGFGWKKVDIAYSGVFYNTRSHQTFFNSLKNSYYMGKELECNFNNLKRV